MPKENKKDCSEYFISLMEGQTKTINLFEDIIKIIDIIINTIIKLQKTTSVIIFLIQLLICQVFLSEIIENIFEKMFKTWGNISENYQILILSIIFGIPAAIFSQIIGSLLFKKIEDKLRGIRKDMKSSGR